MNTTVEIVYEINEFLRDNIVDKHVLEFLVELKMKVLELDEQGKSKRRGAKELSQLEVLLRSIGKRSFVDCYYQLKKAAEGNTSNVSESIIKCSGAKKNSSLRTKGSVGVRLFRLGLNIEALKIIMKADKVEPYVREKALAILEEEEK
jgi:hypothetical protein